MRTMQPHDRKAFTLIELLVVLAVIAILFSLVVPAVLKSRARAHTVSCASQMRQMGIGLTLYVAEHGAYPLAGWIFSGDQVASITWCEAIYPYMTTAPAPASPAHVDKSFTCPSVTPQQGFGNRRFVLTYQINGNRRTSFTGIGAESTPAMTLDQMNAQRVPLSAVEDPRNTFAVVDGRRSPYSYLEANTFLVRSAAELSLNPHSGLNNWLFCDGHVELLHVTNTVGNSTMLTDSRGIWSRTQGD